MVTIQNEQGTINISSDVLTYLTGDAAIRCFGVKGMTVRSVTDGLVHLLRRESMGKGVRVTDNNDGSISIELHIGVDPGVNIPIICDSIKSQVRYTIESTTGVSVKDIHIYVDSIILG